MYTILNGLIGIVVYVSGGRIEPREYDLKEYWTWKGVGRPPWFVRVLKHRCRDQNEDRDTASGGNGTDDMDDSSSMTRVQPVSNDDYSANAEAKL